MRLSFWESRMTEAESILCPLAESEAGSGWFS
jgi:hypothetical protein